MFHILYSVCCVLIIVCPRFNIYFLTLRYSAIFVRINVFISRHQQRIATKKDYDTDVNSDVADAPATDIEQ